MSDHNKEKPVSTTESSEAHKKLMAKMRLEQLFRKEFSFYKTLVTDERVLVDNIFKATINLLQSKLIDRMVISMAPYCSKENYADEVFSVNDVDSFIEDLKKEFGVTA